MKHIHLQLLDSLSAEARASDRLRKNHNFHDFAADPLQRMLNALEPGTYIPPHKHENPDKREAFIILKGKILVVEYDNQGRVVDHVLAAQCSEHYGAEVDPGKWHSVICLEPGTVYYEVKDGPYNPENDKQFAPWAPNEGDPQGVKFNHKVLVGLGLGDLA